MNKKQLLMLSAKAVGLNVVEFQNGVARVETDFKDTGCGWVSGANVPWMPLDEDAEAFRLAVALKIDLMFAQGPADKYCQAIAMQVGIQECEPINVDACAAARKAIVKAAAIMGSKIL